jgi:Cu+-exporting ATPase
VVLWGGWPFFERAWTSVVNRHLNMFTLIGLGVAVAFVYSMIATVAPNIFPPTFRDAIGHVGVYYEAAAAIVALVLLGQVMELRARSRTRWDAGRPRQSCAAPRERSSPRGVRHRSRIP